MTNHGLIDGAFTWLSAREIENQGVISGDELALTADLLRNLPAANADPLTRGVIAANRRLDLGIGVLENRGRIASGGDLVIGGALDADARALGFAQAVLNTGTLTSDGDFVLQAGQLQHSEGALLSGKRVGIDILGDVHVIGAQILASDALALRAGGDIAITSTLRDAGGNTALDQLARVAITDAAASDALTLISGGDLRLFAATPHPRQWRADRAPGQPHSRPRRRPAAR